MHASHYTRSLLLALLVTGTLLGCSPEEQFTEVSQELNRDDYMSSELRARVETLKSAVATEATVGSGCHNRFRFENRIIIGCFD